MFGRGLLLRTTTLLVFILWIVKSLKNLWMLGLLITTKVRFFFWFPVWFQVFSLNCRFSDRVTRVFNKSEVTWDVVLDMPKAFRRICHAGPLQKLESYKISGRLFGLIFSFLGNRQLRVVLDGKYSKLLLLLYYYYCYRYYYCYCY